MSKTASLQAVLDAASSVMMGLASALLIWVLWNQHAERRTSVQNLVERLPAEEIILTLRERPLLGKASEWALVEVSDFQCPFCRRFASETFRDLRREFVESGTLSYFHMNLPLARIHPRAVSAALAAQCAALQGRFWEMYEALFLAPEHLDDATLSRLAERLGLNPEGFDTCRNPDSTTREGRAARAFVEADVAEAERTGLKSTPTFLLGRVRGHQLAAVARINGAVPYETFAEMIREFVNK